MTTAPCTASPPHEPLGAGPRAHHAAVHLVRAAVFAPSLHNTQPWLFTSRGAELDLYADLTRRLPLADPAGRELVISCGAALFNVRLAVRHLGFQPVAHTFPTPRNPAHLAHVGWGRLARPSPAEETLYRAMPHRHTHRGPFRDPSLPPPLVDGLRAQARAQGAQLFTVQPGSDLRRLTGLVRTAERIQRADPRRVAELRRWTREPDDPLPDRLDGVPAEACWYHPDCGGLAGRDFLGLTRTMATPHGLWASRTGLVALLATRQDTPADWLRTGQALQRVLLYATAHHTAVAFHTQPLELPQLRAQIRKAVTCGHFPQMILRLGRAAPGHPTPRRPATTVLTS